MNFSKVHSAHSNVLKATKIDVEADLSNGLHSFTIVGLPDKGIDESKDRVSSAIKNSGYISPKQKNQKVVISLAPAHIKKSGAIFDLPIALAYLKSSKQIDFDSGDKIFVGELSLDGKMRKVSGILPMIIFAKKNKFSEIFIPKQNQHEAELVERIKIYCCENLKSIIDHLENKRELVPLENQTLHKLRESHIEKNSDYYSTISQCSNLKIKNIQGQEKSKRALQISAAGGHNIALYGPPGTGKTMLAQSFIELLPDLFYKQIVESTAIHSSVFKNEKLITRPPFRNPHHTSSSSAILGGGTYIKPGEITLAHNGVLFLDEFPEFNKNIIESLRQPMEDKKINLSRINQKIILPANFILMLAMNPCPCGYFKTGIKKCLCSQGSIEKYRKKVSGPIIDRVDIWTEVGNVEYKKFLNRKKGCEIDAEKFSDFFKRIQTARHRQYTRFKKYLLNANIPNEELEKYCRLKPETKKLLDISAQKLELSPRSYHKIIKIALTIADLDDCDEIKDSHILEALQYRPRF